MILSWILAHLLQGYDVCIQILQLLDDQRQLIASLYVPLHETQWLAAAAVAANPATAAGAVGVLAVSTGHGSGCL
jgi:hypothetical protein